LVGIPTIVSPIVGKTESFELIPIVWKSLRVIPPKIIVIVGLEKYKVGIDTSWGIVINTIVHISGM